MLVWRLNAFPATTKLSIAAARITEGDNPVSSASPHKKRMINTAFKNLVCFSAKEKTKENPEQHKQFPHEDR